MSFLGIVGEIWLTIAIIVILLLLSALFSGSETALTAASRARMYQLAKSGDSRAHKVAALLAIKGRMIGALLLGNNLVNILASALATRLFLNIFGDSGVVYATLVMTVLVLIFAEVLPKSWAISTPERFSLAVSGAVRFIVVIFGPFVTAIEFIVRIALRIVRVGANDHIAILSARDELRGTLDLQHQEGGLVKADRDRIGGLLDLADLEVSDVMIHRTDMLVLNADDPPESIVEAMLRAPYTRIPIWRGSRDNFIGILHAKDVLKALADVNGEISQLKIEKLARPPWFIPDTANLPEQLNIFLKRKAHLALVVDEYGEVMGLLTLEDILEEIVGEIADEHDVDLSDVIRQTDGSVIVDGSLTIRNLNRATDWELPDDRATTIAGLVIHEARAIPTEHQIFTFQGFRFTVLQRERNRLRRLRIVKLPTAPESPLPGKSGGRAGPKGVSKS